MEAQYLFISNLWQLRLVQVSFSVAGHNCQQP